MSKGAVLSYATLERTRRPPLRAEDITYSAPRSCRTRIRPAKRRRKTIFLKNTITPIAQKKEKEEERPVYHKLQPTPNHSTLSTI
jgi:hypothetical protein